MTVNEPGSEIQCIRAGVDRALERNGDQGVDTVAETIFPRTLYMDPGFDWAPELSLHDQRTIDHAASDLYGWYKSMLPVLLTDPANTRGTYFSRMVSWPGKKRDGTNQLTQVINRLRSVHRSGQTTNNTLDIDLSADCLDAATILEGAQIYAATDKRSRGFPCLVHLDFSLLNGRLHCAAVYRHHYLMMKAYGNFLGLSWLMQFICQQSGFEMGELAVLAGLADCENRKQARELAGDLRHALHNGTGGSQ